MVRPTTVLRSSRFISVDGSTCLPVGSQPTRLSLDRDILRRALSLCLVEWRTVNDQSVTQTKYGRLEITSPTSNHDLIDALEDTNFVNNVVRMEKETQRPMMITVHLIM